MGGAGGVEGVEEWIPTSQVGEEELGRAGGGIAVIWCGRGVGGSLAGAFATRNRRRVKQKGRRCLIVGGGK